MEHLAVCESNLLKLSGCLYLTLIHNSEFYFVELVICLCFYGCKKTARFGAIFKTLKGQYGYQTKGLGLGSKNMFVFMIFVFVYIIMGI
jgi:hypothetical protein